MPRERENHRYPWSVLLLGGGAGTGKTTAAFTLGRRSAAAVTQADDIRLSLQRIVPEAVVPALHAFLRRPVPEWDVEPAVAAQLTIGGIVGVALEPVITHHVAAGPPLVLEGDAIRPDVVVRARRGLTASDGTVRAVFLHEPDRRALHAALLARGRGFEALERDEQDAVVAFHHAHGERIVADAVALGLPVLPSRPWRTLVARIEEAAAGPVPVRGGP